MAYRKSRLQRVEEAKAVRSTAFYVVLTIGIIILMFFVGIPALTRVTSLVAGITGQESIDFGGSSPPPPPPEIETPPIYFNADSFRLKGRTRPGHSVSIFFNDDKIEVLADAEGEFTSVLELSAGQNKVSALVIDNRGQESTKTSEYTIMLDKEKPEIEIISPENGKQFFGNRDKEQKIEGQTEADAKVYINDRVVIVRSDGKFDSLVTLSDGENVYKIKAVDRAGNENEAEIKLNFTP